MSLPSLGNDLRGASASEVGPTTSVQTSVTSRAAPIDGPDEEDELACRAIGVSTPVPHLWICHSATTLRNAWWNAGEAYSDVAPMLKFASRSRKKEQSTIGWYAGFVLRRRSSMQRSALAIVSSSQPMALSASTASSADTLRILSRVDGLIMDMKRSMIFWNAGGTSMRRVAFMRLLHWPSRAPAKAISGPGFRKCRGLKPLPRSTITTNSFAPGLFRSMAVHTVYSMCVKADPSELFKRPGSTMTNEHPSWSHPMTREGLPK
mmetsp:Transcript_12919/g.33233  ORF Transcript_12919/g.33233 Transcript_12919/m.33233 type:complete len:263 (+) Transcript_12919:301-1089(+)